MTATLDGIDALLARRVEASERYFAAEAGRLPALVSAPSQVPSARRWERSSAPWRAG